MESFKHFINILVDELKKSIEKEVVNVFEQRINQIIADSKLSATQKTSENYYFMDLLCQKYRVGQTTFYNILKQHKVHRIRKGRYYLYNEKQFILALRNTKPEKPKF
jgi:hypothetical protein